MTEDDQAKWNAIFETPDPFDYTSEYERIKYLHTLKEVVNSKPRAVVELACAEGSFTNLLAPHVESLLGLCCTKRLGARVSLSPDGFIPWLP